MRTTNLHSGTFNAKSYVCDCTHSTPPRHSLIGTNWEYLIVFSPNLHLRKKQCLQQLGTYRSLWQTIVTQSWRIRGSCLRQPVLRMVKLASGFIFTVPSFQEITAFRLARSFWEFVNEHWLFMGCIEIDLSWRVEGKSRWCRQPPLWWCWVYMIITKPLRKWRKCFNIYS